MYTHPCTDHVVEVTILYQYPDSNLDVEYYIYNNITTQFGFGTFIIDDDYLSEQICLLDGCYRIYMSPQGQMQEILWEIKVDGLITLVSESYDTYINFSVGTRVCNSGGCNNQQACNFSPYDMSTSDCCYECTEVELAQGQIPGITQWEVRSTNANAQLEASGDALFNGAVCFDIQAFTTTNCACPIPKEMDGTAQHLLYLTATGIGPFQRRLKLEPTNLFFLRQEVLDVPIQTHAITMMWRQSMMEIVCWARDLK